MCGMKPEQNVAAQRSPAEEPWEDLMFLTASDTQELQLRRTEEFQNPGRCLGSGQPCDPHGGVRSRRRTSHVEHQRTEVDPDVRGGQV